MVQSAGLVFGMALFTLVAVVALMVATGIVIYKDAKTHGMNGWMWAAIAVFAPNFIGVILYLIIRHGAEKQYECSKCGSEVKASYNICPNCKGVFESMCSVCNNGIKSNMAYCPYCGNETKGTEKMPTANELIKRTPLVKSLAIIGGIYIAVFIIVMGTMFTMAFASGELRMNASVMEVESNTFNKKEARFKYKYGKEKMTFKLDENEEQMVDIEIGLTEGKIILQVVDPSGQIIDERVYEVGDYKEDLIIKAREKGKYSLSIQVEKASGSYKISKKE